MDADQKSGSIRMTGVSISPGLASGRAYVYQDIFEQELTRYEIAEDQIEGEYARIQSAVEIVLDSLRASAQHLESNNDDIALAEIIHAQEEVFNDPGFAKDIRTELALQKTNAEVVLKQVVQRWEHTFQGINDLAFQQRGVDFTNLGRRLLRVLNGENANTLKDIPPQAIVVAHHLLPSDTITLAHQHCAGALLEYSGVGSHFSILMREFGIPVVSQIGASFKTIKTGDWLLLDGLNGQIIVNPDVETEQEFQKHLEAYQDSLIQAKLLCHQPALTQSDTLIEVMANIGSRKDAELAVANGADGVGLFRLEKLFFAFKSMPTADELSDAIDEAIAPLHKMPIKIRLLDIGGDKQLPYLKLPNECNPALGMRGVRFLFKYPDLLDLQLRVLLKLSSKYDLHIIIPMVTVADDVRRIRARIEELAAEVGVEQIPKVGSMIETPAAALCTDELIEYADFISIGTNDLTQYTMATDRDNKFVSHYFQDAHPAIFKLLDLTVKQSEGVPVTVCGELAAQTEQIQALLNIGIRSLSVAPPLIPVIKDAIRGL